MSHWKTLFDYEYLGCHDLPRDADKNVLDITVKILSIAKKEITGKGGKKSIKPVAVLQGASKPWIVNKTNFDKMAQLFGTTEHEDFIGKSITLFPDKVKNPEGAGKVDGLRIRDQKPEERHLPELNPFHPRWDGAKKAFKNGDTTLEQLKQFYIISSENEDLLNS